MAVQSAPPQLATLGWAVKRAFLGLLMLIVMVALGAWLLWASIDPDEAAAGNGPERGGITAQQR